MEKEPVPSSTTEAPQPKKRKMSTTTTSDDEEFLGGAGDGSAPAKKPRYKRRKIAIFFAYCGVGYQGMQKNPGAKTIEGDLEEALYEAGGVPDHDKCQPRKYEWARSARTDKGVSAVGQVVSGRFYVDPPGFIDRLNSILVPQIRIFGFKRVTNAFSAKKFCDKRRDVNINVPMAPEVGLYLDECFFTSYNSKWKDTHEEVSLKAYLEQAEEFKMKYIYSHIASTEHKEGTMALWLHSLNHRNYPDLRAVDNVNPAGDGSEVVETAVEAGLGSVNNGESTDNVNSVDAGPEVAKTVVEAGLGAVENGESTNNVNSAGPSPEVVKTVIEAGLGAVNDGESTDNVNSAGDGSEVVETVVEADLVALNNGESTDAKNGEAAGDADLVNS